MGLAALVRVVANPRRMVVEGTSMVPELAPGDRLIVVRPRAIVTGDLVAVRDPLVRGRLLVKRVVSACPEGIDVRGDNEGASRDSREFGLVPASSVAGRVVHRYFPVDRAGRLRRAALRSDVRQYDS